ncbi:MAG: cytochrome c3 family protein [Desulfosarcina sp.]
MRSLSCVGVVWLIGMIACASMGIAVAADEEMCVPMGVIRLEPPASVEAKRASVAFDHSRHFVLTCNQCHHTWEGAEPVTGCMTAGCHDLDTLPRKDDSKVIDKDQAFRYYKNAYHGQCIGCHKTMQQEIQQMANTLAGIDGTLPATGPTGCIACHPKD